MTPTPYGPAATEPGWVTPLKIATAVSLVLVGAAAAAVAAFVGVIVYTGCFISCSGGNQAGGLLLYGLALALLLTGPALARLMWRRARTPASAKVWGALALGLPLGLVLIVRLQGLLG